jgi:cobalt-zinc-cadmium efflux system membrane fusion protein
MTNPIAVIILAAILLAACSESGPPAKVEAQLAGHAGESAAVESKGPHGGRVLVDSEFRLELVIFESGIEPEFRAWAWQGDTPVPPAEWRLEVTLIRLGEVTHAFTFQAHEDFQRGDDVVSEPHSFQVEVRATANGATHSWKYDSFEGRTTISAQAASASGIEVETAGPAQITETLELQGTVVPDPQRVYRILARYPGVLKTIRPSIGDRVRAGEVLATIESSESLRVYTLSAPNDGVVVSRKANAGETVGAEEILTLVDFSSVWVELAAFQHDLDRIQVGQTVRVRDADGHQLAVGTLQSIAPVGSPASQSMTARVVLPNPDGLWRPGLFASGTVTVAENQVPLAVRRLALQTFRDWTVVFQKAGDAYEIRPVTLGRTNAIWAEVLDGLEPGAEYVTSNSFVIKADIEKSGAKHDH